MGVITRWGLMAEAQFMSDLAIGVGNVLNKKKEERSKGIPGKKSSINKGSEIGANWSYTHPLYLEMLV